MKKIVFKTLIIVCICLVVTCSQENMNGSAPLQPNATLAAVLTPAVGDAIAPDLAAQWINAFRQQHASANVMLSHDLSRQTIEQLLAVKYASHPVDGLRFIKGINETGEETLVVIPVQGGNDLWYLSYLGSEARTQDTGTAYDKNGPLNINTAKQWVKAFRDRHTADTHRSYFVGHEALLQIVSSSYNDTPVDGLRFYKALNDNQKETFVIAPIQDGQTLGTLESRLSGSSLKSLKTAGEDVVVYIEYMSPCPSSCPEE
jgi:hypothetical protein